MALFEGATALCIMPKADRTLDMPKVTLPWLVSYPSGAQAFTRKTDRICRPFFVGGHKN